MTHPSYNEINVLFFIIFNEAESFLDLGKIVHIIE